MFFSSNSEDCLSFSFLIGWDNKGSRSISDTHLDMAWISVIGISIGYFWLETNHWLEKQYQSFNKYDFT